MHLTKSNAHSNVEYKTQASLREVNGE